MDRMKVLLPMELLKMLDVNRPGIRVGDVIRIPLPLHSSRGYQSVASNFPMSSVNGPLKDFTLQ
jgi:hypothetical protein